MSYDAILTAAIDEAKENGLLKLKRLTVARRAACSASLVNHYFGTTIGLRQAVVREAIKLANLSVIGQALIARDPIALAAPIELRQRAAAEITG